MFEYDFYFNIFQTFYNLRCLFIFYIQECDIFCYKSANRIAKQYHVQKLDKISNISHLFHDNFEETSF